MRFLLLSLFLSAAPAAFAAAPDACGCARKCRKAAKADDCRTECRDACQRAEKTVVDGELLTTGRLDESVAGLSDEELAKWEREYERRRGAMDRKCAAAPPDDPRIKDIERVCADGKTGIQLKLREISDERAARRQKAAAEEQRKRLCPQGRRIGAKAYCASGCGKCNALGQPEDWLAEDAEAAEKAAAKRAPKKKADKQTAPAGCAAYDTQLQTCLKSGQLGRKACESQARRVTAAQCQGMKSLFPSGH